MEVCDGSDSTHSTEFTERISCLDDREGTNRRNKNAGMNSTIQDGDSGMNRVSESDLDRNLLSFFEGNPENVEYYLQLRNLTSRWNEKEQGPMICDPRDLKKVEQTRNWQPKSKIEDLRDLLKRCKAENLDFPTKQIAVEVDAENGLVNKGDSCGKYIAHEDKDLSKR